MAGVLVGEKDVSFLYLQLTVKVVQVPACEVLLVRCRYNDFEEVTWYL